MKETYTMHVVPHSHWDREWYFTFEEFRYRLVKMFDRLLPLMEEGTIQYFVADGHTLLIDDYLEIRPENEDRMRALIEAKRILIGPWYTQPNIFMCDAESQIRNLLRGREEMRKYGGGMEDIDYLPDQFGFHTQLPQIHAGFGITHLVGARGMPKGCPNYFVWEGADGTRTMVCSLWHSYHNGKGLSPREEPVDFPLFGGVIHMPSLPELLDVILLEKERAVAPHLLAMNGVDHMYPNPEMKGTLAKIEALHEDIVAVQDTLKGYIEAVESSLDKPLTTYKGELRDPREEYILTASQSMRMDIKKYNGRMQDALETRVEPMIARMQALGEKHMPMAHLKKAWEYLLQNQAHDSLCCANSEPSYREIYTRYEKCDDIAREISTELEQRMIRRIKGLPQDAIVVYNPTTFERDEPLDFEIITAVETGWNTQPHLSYDGQDIPLYIHSVRSDALLRYVPFSGLVGQIPVRIFKVTADVGKISAGGYKAFSLTLGAAHAKPVEGIVNGPDALENEYLRVKINANGTMDVFDKARNQTYREVHRFMDDGEAGCGFMHIAPTGDFLAVSSGAGLNLRIMDNSPLRGVIRMRQVFRLPKSLTPDMSARSEESTDVVITTDVILRKGARHVEYKTTIDNTACDHRLRIAFPTDTQTDQGYAGQPFDVVRRPVQPEDVNKIQLDEMEPWYGWQPMHDFCGIADETRGATIAADGVLEYEILPMRNTIGLTLIRATDRLHVGVLATGSKFKLPKAQLLGKNTFRYAFIPHGADYGEALGEVSKFRHPCYTAQKDFLEEESMPDYVAPQPDLEPQGGFIQVDGGVITSAIKPAEDGNGFILRMYNPLEKEVQARVSVLEPFALAGASLTRMDECDQQQLETENGAFALHFAPKQIQSVRMSVQKAL